MATLNEFLSAGRLGPVQLGLRPEQVVALLGDADDRSARRRPVTVLRYGAVELTFTPIPDTDDSRLSGISVKFAVPGLEIPVALRPNDWLPDGRTSPDEVRRYLEGQGITGVEALRGDDGDETLTLSTGAAIVFADGSLFGMHFRRRDKRPDRKQLTVALPEETVEELRRRARAEHTSVQALLERMIKAAS
ncbi:MAG TPA: ribbon-helix-helix protein, CopG family [Tepidisphaeraceae bacterium]|nr:ribbon-helix-helix protein, CopG family [Tepidisphaeraceae bacterium]